MEYPDLVDWQIQHALNKGDIFISPFNKDNIQSNSYDVTLSDSFKIYHKVDDWEGHIVDPYDQSTMDHIHNSRWFEEIDGVDSIIIYPGQAILASTREFIALGPDIRAEIFGKSSIARLFVEQHQTGAWIDAGFRGEITLEMVRNFPWPIRLHVGMPIAQLTFTRTEPCKLPYNLRKSAKYNHQKGAQVTKYAENKR